MDIPEKSLKGLFWRADFYGASTEGGMASMHLGLLNGFLKLGHSAAFASCGRMALPEGVPYYYIPYNKIFRNFPEVLNLAYNPRNVRELKKIIEKEKPDFLYQHHADFSTTGSTLRKELGIPFFLQCEGVQQWVKKNWGKLYFEKALKWAELTQWGMADAIFVISQKVKDMIVEYGGDGSKVFVHPSAVDPDQFSPVIDGSRIRKKYNLENNYVCGFTGTFAQWHGVEVLAESVKYIIKLIPNAKVLFVGDGMLRPQIEEILRRDGMEINAIITGTVPYPQVPEYLSACDVLLSPCVHNSDTEFFNSPVKLFEYMGMGKPIVASDVGQQGDVINHNVNGLLCRERDPQELAESIYSIYKDESLAHDLGIEARKSAVEKYDWKWNAKGVVDVFNRIQKSEVRSQNSEFRIQNSEF
jgi:glycosyltransferase involved in cell wall biosynthesis